MRGESKVMRPKYVIPAEAGIQPIFVVQASCLRSIPKGLNVNIRE